MSGQKTKKKRKKDKEKKDKEAKRRRDKKTREFKIVTSGQFRTLAMFYGWLVRNFVG